MVRKFQFADMHCHPNLKTYGHSFDACGPNEKCNVWYYKPPRFLTKFLNISIGITRFSQADFTSLSKGGAGIVFASLYPFEKGFFINAAGKGPLSAFLSDMITGIGYERVRNLQHHVNYFEDLEKEYSFFIESQKNHVIDKREYGWLPAGNWNETKEIIEKKNITAVLLSIEGAHVFNSGLTEFGKKASESEIIENIKKVKQWKFPPVFITFAHNFNNELCGHANSLEPIKAFVDQSTGINTGFTPLGKTVLHHLLSDQNGRPVFIDIKHMSLKARKEYFEIIETDYRGQRIPTLVSHGAVNGMQWNGLKTADLPDVFYPSDINFFDEEIVAIGKGGGLFAIQFDTRRIAQKNLVKKRLNSLFGKSDVKRSALLIWYQIVHITRILDKAGIFGWGTAAIGSDYDGTIDPLPGIWSSEQFPLLENELFRLASDYLNGNPPLKVMENKMITAGEVVNRFFIDNTIRFLKENC